MTDTRTEPGRYFEDYPVGAVFTGGPLPAISEEDILDFARRYDPQPMHIDKAAADSGSFGGLIASGWHTGSLMMQLLARHFVPHGNLASPGLDELRWVRPVRPGDRLSLRATVESARRSRSKPDQGVVVSRVEVLNQNGEVMMTLKPISLMRCRPA